MPKGPKGRFVSMLPRLQGVWNFSKNKSAAKSLMLHVSSRDSAERLVAGNYACAASSSDGSIQFPRHLGEHLEIAYRSLLCQMIN
jgi:hypothetical protein